MSKFILFSKGSNLYYWRLEANNYEPICHSEMYSSKQAALGGVDACRKLSLDIGNYRIFQGNDSQYYWHLKSSNGQIICQSEGYTTKQGSEKGIASCKSNAWSAPVEERSLSNV